MSYIHHSRCLMNDLHNEKKTMDLKSIQIQMSSNTMSQTNQH